MSLTLRKRRVAIEVPATWMGRVKTRAVQTGERMSPMADQARMAATHRIEDARSWAAPRLESAAHGIEDQVAPYISSMLTAAARKIEPARTRSRKWPMLVLMTGLAVGAMGYMAYRRNAQQWTEHMKDSASDASRWVSEKADRTADMASGVSDRADETSRKMS
ncbi:hypothetical protein AB0K40_40615 [Nonomuraea bangladeshensis]|uniref:YtxH domain-containing protein n=1 Tax=Nonomuraea bangladeshensis TaxID=404385 RepID=A0ABV3HH29_9ACTN